MNEAMLKDFSSPGNLFLCPFCVKRGDSYDFQAALSRCRSSCDGNVSAAAVNEVRLLRLYRTSLPIVCGMDASRITVHEPTVTLMEEKQSVARNKFIPVTVGADGNCFFRSVSMSLYGTENYHEHLRLRAFIEVAQNRDFYDCNSDKFYAPFKGDNRLLLLSFSELCRVLATPGAYVDMLAVLAVSSVICRPIQTFWPLVCQSGDDSPFNQLVVGRNVSAGPGVVNIMWTDSVYRSGSNLQVNHFVPLYERLLPIDSSQSPKPTIHVTHTLGESSDTDDLMSDSDRDCDTAPGSSEVEGKAACDLAGAFLPPEQCCILLNAKTVVVPKVPFGKKNNICFVTDNSHNVERHKRGLSSVYWDDCGAWSDGRSKKRYFLNDLQQEIFLSDGLYCARRQVDRIRSLVPLESQPDKKDVIIVTHYYSKLKRHSDYERRVTSWSNDSSVLLYEYKGVMCDDISEHGNSRKNTTEYLRTMPQVTEKIRDEIRCSKKRPRQVYEDNVLNSESAEAQPRNLKQVRYLASTVMRENKRCQSSSSGNIADDMQKIVSSVGCHEFIRSVFFNDGNKPCIMLYTDHQINDIKRFCTRNSNEKIQSVLGIDRTFNLSPYYVTVTVYKNRSVVRPETQDHPIMLGPMIVHGDGNFNTYMLFLCQLKALVNDDLGSTEVRVNDDILFGSDDEKALIKAIGLTFGSKQHLYCTLHIQGNVRDYMSKVGIPQAEKSEIIRMLFGSDGIAASNNIDEFNIRQLQMQITLRQNNIDDKLISYLIDKVCPKLRSNVNVSACDITDGCHLKLWTNNNCESANHLLKMKTDWKPCRILDLINYLHDLVKLQYAEVQRALYGQGSFKVISPFSKHIIPASQWMLANEARKQLVFAKFMSDTGKRVDSKTVTSADGELTIPSSPSIARKPNQRRRSRAEKTQKKS